MKFTDLPVHHALLVSHYDRSTYANSLWGEISKASPAHRYFNQTVLDIDTAREIISFAQSPYSGDKVALISFHSASLPAQNAMLKILEEPRENMRFVLVTTNKDNFIPTILSRVRHVPLSISEASIDHALEFFMTSPSYRMKLSFVGEILASLDEEGRKNREAVKGFILSLVAVAKVKKIDSRYITETLEVASYASDPSASGKALIEYLSLLLPQTK